MVNASSYSAAEYFACAIQEYGKGAVVGEHTFGKGYYQVGKPLSDGSCINLSIGKYFTPNGKSLIDVGVTPDIEVELTEEQAGARMDGIADRLLDALADAGPLGDSAVALAEKRRLKATARTCAAVLAEHMRGSRFNPSDLETDFGVEDRGPARLTVNAASGECVLEGRIDRIDEWAAGGYLRVIDYKLGGKDLALDAVYHGLSLQLPVYLAAAMKKRSK